MSELIGPANCHCARVTSKDFTMRCWLSKIFCCILECKACPKKQEMTSWQQKGSDITLKDL